MPDQTPSDPASLNVTVTLTGLSRPELETLLGALPARARFAGAANRPAVGGTRYELTVQSLSIQAASDLTGALLAHLSDPTP